MHEMRCNYSAEQAQCVRLFDSSLLHFHPYLVRLLTFVILSHRFFNNNSYFIRIVHLYVFVRHILMVTVVIFSSDDLTAYYHLNEHTSEQLRLPTDTIMSCLLDYVNMDYIIVLQ